MIIKVEFYKPGCDEAEREFHYNLQDKDGSAKARRSIVWALKNGLIVISGEKRAMAKDAKSKE